MDAGPPRSWEHEHTFGQDVRRPGEPRTFLVIGITASMMIVEIIAGMVFGSMALLADGLAPGELVNVNIPALKAGWPVGVRVAPQSTDAIRESYTRETDAEGRILFRLDEYYEHRNQQPETDVAALAEGFITVTPLKSDMTDADQLASLQRRRWSKPPA